MLWYHRYSAKDTLFSYTSLLLLFSFHLLFCKSYVASDGNISQISNHVIPKIPHWKVVNKQNLSDIQAIVESKEAEITIWNKLRYEHIREVPKVLSKQIRTLYIFALKRDLNAQ